MEKRSSPHLIKNGKKIDCDISNYVPFVVPGISASSSSTVPSSTSSPSIVITGVNIGLQRFSIGKQRCGNSSIRKSGSTSEELRRDPLHDSTETENQNINRETKEAQRDFSHELPYWLQEFMDNFVDETTSEELR